MDVSSWTVTDVSNYLNQLGLGQYSESFIKNDIDGSVLPFITDDDLKEIGVQNLGHRIKIRNFVGATIKEDISFPPLYQQSDSIHPLPQSAFNHMFSENQAAEKIQDGDMVKCSICHRHVPLDCIQYHENLCKNAFIKCKNEYKQRGINMSDQDIIKLLSGEIPENSIQLQKCQFCNKKISPKIFQKHQEQCRKRKEEQEKKAALNSHEKKCKNNFIEKHKELIEFIHEKKKQISTNNNTSNEHFPESNINEK